MIAKNEQNKNVQWKQDKTGTHLVINPKAFDYHSTSRTERRRKWQHKRHLEEQQRIKKLSKKQAIDELLAIAKKACTAFLEAAADSDYERQTKRARRSPDPEIVSTPCPSFYWETRSQKPKSMLKYGNTPVKSMLDRY